MDDTTDAVKACWRVVRFFARESFPDSHPTRKDFSTKESPRRRSVATKALCQGEGNRRETIPSRQNGFTRAWPQGFKFSEESLPSRVTEEMAVIKPEVSKRRHSEGYAP